MCRFVLKTCIYKVVILYVLGFFFKKKPETLNHQAELSHGPFVLAYLSPTSFPVLASPHFSPHTLSQLFALFSSASPRFSPTSQPAWFSSRQHLPLACLGGAILKAMETSPRWWHPPLGQRHSHGLTTNAPHQWHPHHDGCGNLSTTRCPPLGPASPQGQGCQI